MSIKQHYMRLIVLDKLASLGTRKNILSNWASDAEVYAIWRRRKVVTAKDSHNAGVSWIRKGKENGILAELIYRTYREAFPRNADLKEAITPFQLYELYLMLHMRVQNKAEFSTTRMYHLFRAIASSELKVNSTCRSCGTYIVDDIDEINSHCSLCRYFQKKKHVENAPAKSNTGLVTQTCAEIHYLECREKQTQLDSARVM